MYIQLSNEKRTLVITFWGCRLLIHLIDTEGTESYKTSN